MLEKLTQRFFRIRRFRPRRLALLLRLLFFFAFSAPWTLTASTRSLYVHLPVIIWSSRGRESRVSCQDRAQNEAVRFLNTHSSSAYPFGS